MIRLALYGSLRKGMHNYNRFIPGLEPLSTERVEGYKMHSLSSYPGIVPDDDSGIVVEVYDIDGRTASRMASMELNAGYYMEYVDTSVGKAIIFVYGSSMDRFPDVEGGDWVKYYRSKDEDYGA